MSTQRIAFWTEIIERLNSDNDMNTAIPEVLGSLCTFLGFGSGFIYHMDYAGIMHLQEHHALYDNDSMEQQLDLKKVLGEELLNVFALEKWISFRDATEKDETSQRLAGIFAVRAMDLVPVRDEKSGLIAMVGVADRRGVIRGREEDASFTYSILCTLANHIKLRLYQRRVESAKEALESIMDNMGVDIYVNDFNTHEILYVNQSMARPYGGKECMMGKRCWETLYDDMPGQCEYCPQKKLIDENGEPTKIYSWDYERPFDGSWFRVLSAAFRWVDGRLAHVVSSVDITENKRNEEIIRQLAEIDELTGVSNRYKLMQETDRRLDAMREKGEEGYMIFFDLDGFKKVNDTLGHQAGDELLQQIGARLMESPLTQGRCYRYGGDEFVVLCDASSPGTLRETIAFLTGLFETPWQLKAGKAFCQNSIGIARFPVDDITTTGLMRKADEAMYESKRKGPGRVHFYNGGTVCPAEEYWAREKIL